MDECPKTDVDSCAGELPIVAERALYGDDGSAQMKGLAEAEREADGAVKIVVREGKCIAEESERDLEKAERDADRLEGAVEGESERAAGISEMEPERDEGEWKRSMMEMLSKIHTRVEYEPKIDVERLKMKVPRFKLDAEIAEMDYDRMLPKMEELRSIAQRDVVDSDDPIVARFVRRLAEFYKATFAQVSTEPGDGCLYKDICVSLRAENSSVLIDHVGLINKFRSETSMALVVGEHGAGKTTFLKRIAFDWANQILKVNKRRSWLRGLTHITSSSRQFTWIGLVIVANLGSYRPADDTTSLIEFALRSCKVTSGDYEQSYDARRLASFFDRHENLLICLDGLDEYTGDSDVLLRCMKANRHHKVIVTSRPNANVEVFAARLSPDQYHIQPFTDSQIRSFVRSHCKLPVDQHSVKECLRCDAVLFTVPLILSFVCQLANEKRDISANLTQVYDLLVCQFIWKPNRSHIGASISIANFKDSADWKMCPEAKRLCQLAFFGCAKGKFEFSMDETTMFGVTKDIRKFGIFIRRSNLKAEFLHPSVQEYFAAQKCYDDILSDDSNSDWESAANLIAVSKGNLGRFFFGICSKEMIFKQYLDGNETSVADKPFGRQLSTLFEVFSTISAGGDISTFLTDICRKSEIDKIRQLLNVSRANLDFFTELLRIPISPVGYVQTTMPKGNRSSNQRETVALVCGQIPSDHKCNLSSVEMLWWYFGYNFSSKYIGDLLAQIDKFTSIRHLNVCEVNGRSHVSFRIQYAEGISCATQLKVMNFRFDKLQLKILRRQEYFGDILNQFHLRQDEEILSISQHRNCLLKKSRMEEIWAIAKVTRSVDAKVIFATLIQKALDFFDTNVSH